MSNVRFSDRADDDLREIFIYGIEQFGIRQAEKYIADLKRVFRLLADQPRMGAEAPGIGIGVRRHVHANHIVLYEAVDDGVLILAVVHGSSVRRMKL